MQSCGPGTGFDTCALDWKNNDIDRIAKNTVWILCLYHVVLLTCELKKKSQLTVFLIIIIMLEKAAFLYNGVQKSTSGKM